eukprot:scaffold20350_cov84-Amphora_coffeaeformis.AAC.1
MQTTSLASPPPTSAPSPPPPIAGTTTSTVADLSTSPISLLVPESSLSTTSSAEDFTMLPKELDAKLEVLDTDNALRSTVLKAG